MPTAIRQSEWKISSIILKKIAPYGVWGNGRFPQLNLPSALAVAKQGYRFLFAYWDVLIDFMEKLMPLNLIIIYHFNFNREFVDERYGIGFSWNQLPQMFWQIKNYTLVGKFDFWGCLICLLKWVFSIYYKCCCDTLWHLQKTMKILYRFWVGALAERIFYIMKL